jgi:hypothetical protein
MRRILLSFVIGTAVFASTLGVGSVGAGCKGTAGAGGSDQTNPLVLDVVFEGGATDEAAVALLQATLVSDPTSAANFTAPINMMVVPAASAPTFSWKIGVAAADRPPSDVRFTLLEPPSIPQKLATRALGALLSGVPSAYAHGTPVSGPAYFLNFSTATNPKLLRVFTTNMTYTPDATVFAKLKAAATTIHAVITNAQFDQNRIAQAGGPWKGNEITFTIQ